MNNKYDGCSMGESWIAFDYIAGAPRSITTSKPLHLNESHTTLDALLNCKM